MNLLWLPLANNMITVIHPSMFQQQDRLDHLDISRNRYHSIKPDTFNDNRSLLWLSLANNMITVIQISCYCYCCCCGTCIFKERSHIMITVLMYNICRMEQSM